MVFTGFSEKYIYFFHLIGNNKQHYHPEHDLHEDVSQVWAVGRQPCQHSVWAGFLHWASSGQGGWNSFSLLFSLSLPGLAISHFLPCVSGGLVLPFFRSLPPPVFLSWGTPTHCALMRSCTVIGAWEASSVQCFPLFRSLDLSLLCIMMMHCQELGVENLTNTFRLPPLSLFFILFHSPLSLFLLLLHMLYLLYKKWIITIIY